MNISKEKFIETIYNLIKKAVISSPIEVKEALKECLLQEEEHGQYQISLMLENLELATEKKCPLCQDTGVPIFFVNMGRCINLNFDIKEAIKEAVIEATNKIPLRRNVVHPITRKFIGNNDNTGFGFPYCWFDLTEEDSLEITFLPKGGGSENMSVLKMMNSVTRLEEVENFIVETAINFMGKPCPPYIMGVGIGGGSDIALHLAKKATLRKITQRNSDKIVAKLEEDFKKRINDLGIGPMGRGGKNTVLAVNIETIGVHTSVYPVAITNQCWPGRKAKVRISLNGDIQFE
ncbi:MAG: fumarate hydratase [bacterium]|nr:fumarate hydratase [bacterium]